MYAIDLKNREFKYFQYTNGLLDGESSGTLLHARGSSGGVDGLTAVPPSSAVQVPALGGVAHPAHDEVELAQTQVVQPKP